MVYQFTAVSIISVNQQSCVCPYACIIHLCAADLGVRASEDLSMCCLQEPMAERTWHLPRTETHMHGERPHGQRLPSDGRLHQRDIADELMNVIMSGDSARRTNTPTRCSQMWAAVGDVCMNTRVQDRCGRAGGRAGGSVSVWWWTRAPKQFADHSGD